MEGQPIKTEAIIEVEDTEFLLNKAVECEGIGDTVKANYYLDEAMWLEKVDSPTRVLRVTWITNEITWSLESDG